MMKNDYDIFERFADGSTIWRSCVCGKYEAQRKIEELSKDSENKFYAINLKENKPLWLDRTPKASESAGKHFKQTA